MSGLASLSCTPRSKGGAHPVCPPPSPERCATEIRASDRPPRRQPQPAPPAKSLRICTTSSLRFSSWRRRKTEHQIRAVPRLCIDLARLALITCRGNGHLVLGSHRHSHSKLTAPVRAGLPAHFLLVRPAHARSEEHT